MLVPVVVDGVDAVGSHEPAALQLGLDLVAHERAGRGHLGVRLREADERDVGLAVERVDAQGAPARLAAQPRLEVADRRGDRAVGVEGPVGAVRGIT